jgi:hypothetical protein
MRQEAMQIPPPRRTRQRRRPGPGLREHYENSNGVADQDHAPSNRVQSLADNKRGEYGQSENSPDGQRSPEGAEKKNAENPYVNINPTDWHPAVPAVRLLRFDRRRAQRSPKGPQKKEQESEQRQQQSVPKLVPPIQLRDGKSLTL